MGDQGGPAYCAGCGTCAPDGPPITWSTDLGPRGVQVLCEECTRANVRAIEAKLGSEWW